MVFVNGQKFACESCIKGHRSSSCHHTDRPLFEVKKKGRPVSQCEKCRELRKTKRVHSKCACSSGQEDEAPAKRQLSAKSKRFIPILPALPNGLKDVLTPSAAPIRVNTRGTVTNLLNPCTCKDIWSCRCAQTSASAALSDNAGRLDSRRSLAALADAAALCCGQDINAVPATAPSSQDSTSLTAQVPNPTVQKHPRDCCQSSPKSRSKKLRRRSPTPTQKDATASRGPDLPPLLGSAFDYGSPVAPPPVFPDIPPLSSVASIAGSGCCCGFRCTCVGCVEHRGVEHASKDHKDCPDGCGSCIDYDGGIELPTLGSAPEPKPTNFVDAFFARATASIPRPPSQRRASISFDPVNITVYPSTLFSGPGNIMEEQGAAFGGGGGVGRVDFPVSDPSGAAASIPATPSEQA
ncbi:hypothetical protein EIP91_009510 [Steccherinum ochraceum]|uniref:Copper-fist domain-containing protein n=1 Tax=Steccherinum ochraceum TaxID=92696 RepID=A0A4V2MV25_9APHY|nr:hypothetical protein EIP91_009510 [Steccherinum ochraceum]